MASKLPNCVSGSVEAAAPRVEGVLRTFLTNLVATLHGHHGDAMREVLREVQSDESPTGDPSPISVGTQPL